MIEKGETDARQGKTLNRMRYVLIISFTLAAIALVSAYYFGLF